MGNEMLVGLNVNDPTEYQKYRHAMTPILESYGGSFGYDFKIAEVLISETEELINRLFTIRFPSELAKDRFFSDPAYLQIKKVHFLNAVAATTIIASYDFSPDLSKE